jgi:hypothetical protein
MELRLLKMTRIIVVNLLFFSEGLSAQLFLEEYPAQLDQLRKILPKFTTLKQGLEDEYFEIGEQKQLILKGIVTSENIGQYRCQAWGDR